MKKQSEIIEDLGVVAERIERRLKGVYPDPLGTHSFKEDIKTMVDLIKDLRR
jgi:hypothetical protein